jgi:hypothetical protein
MRDTQRVSVSSKCIDEILHLVAEAGGFKRFIGLDDRHMEYNDCKENERTKTLSHGADCRPGQGDAQQRTKNSLIDKTPED